LSTIVKRFLRVALPQSPAGFRSSDWHNGKKALFGGVSVLGLIAALTFALGAEPATARTRIKALHREADRKGSEPFGNVAKGLVQIFVSINQQKLHLYSDGIHIADTSVATGVPRLPTPTGVFSVIQKQVFHRSNLYSDAPMPFMQRITWSGVALHEGENIGHPASHGCIRMPGDFAARLYKFTRVGARVIVAKAELKPVDFADPHLFVHKDIVAAATPDADAVKTTQSVDAAKASDVIAAATPFDLGLRGAAANVATSFVVAASDDIKSGIAADAVRPDPSKSDSPPADAAKTVAAKSDMLKVDAVAAAGTDAATGRTPAITPVIAAPETPPVNTAAAAPVPVIKKTPIAIFISRKEKKIYVRQDFEPIFEEAITIEHPEEPIGTTVFTAMELLPDNATFRWNVVTMPGEAARAPRSARIVAEEESYYYYDRYGFRHVMHKRVHNAQPVAEVAPPQTPQEVLARIDLPQDAIDFISQRIVPGSSLIVSDHGLGGETGEGTDFIVVTR